MRYTVRYSEFARAWAVIDTKSLNRVIAIHDDPDDAKDDAWAEEEGWRKCHPPTPRILNAVKAL